MKRYVAGEARTKDMGHAVSVEFHVQVSLCSVLPMMEQIKYDPFLKMKNIVKSVQHFFPRKPIETQHPRFYWAGHTGTLSLACSKFQIPKSKTVALMG